MVTATRGSGTFSHSTLNRKILLFNIDNKKFMAKKTFESALSRLEQLTEELEEGELGLDKSLKKFDEGIKLAHFCSEQLEEARAKITLLLEKDDKLEEIPFEANDND